jgi:hypothetical protein
LQHCDWQRVRASCCKQIAFGALALNIFHGAGAAPAFKMLMSAKLAATIVVLIRACIASPVLKLAIT